MILVEVGRSLKGEKTGHRAACTPMILALYWSQGMRVILARDFLEPDVCFGTTRHSRTIHYKQ